MQGWISLHRKLMDNPIWTDSNYLKLWVYCLFKASHKEHDQLIGNQLINLSVGEFITGREALELEMNKGVKPKNQLNGLTWFRYLKNLEKWGMLNIKSNNKFSVVTVVNYGVYQQFDNHFEQQPEQRLNNKRTTTEQQLNTNNNVNKGNNDNKINATTTTANPIQFFESTLCRLSPNQMQSLYNWLDDFNGQAEIISEAIKIADNKNKRFYGFVEMLLKEWSNNKLDSLDRVQAYETEKFNRGNITKKGHNKQNGTRSLFAQGEESRKRQEEEYKPLFPELTKNISDDELPY